MLNAITSPALRPEHGHARGGNDGSAWAERCAYWAERRPSSPKEASRRSRRQPLILSGHGVRLQVDHGALLVQNGRTHYPQQREEWRLFPGDWRLPSRIVILDGDGGLSLDAIAWLAEHGVPLVRIDWRGEVVHVTGHTGAIDQRLRDAQVAARTNGHGLALSRRLIAEKIANSMDTLRHAFPRSPATELALKRIARDAELMRTRPPSTVSDLLGVEGRVAMGYFAAWQAFPLRWKGTGRHPIPDDWKRISPRASMVSGRNHRNRHSTHPVNAMLNYAYGVLEHYVRMHVAAAGLDPMVGYFHGTYRGKPALIYDLMEPLRPLADRQVLELAKAHVLSPADICLGSDGVCRLNPELARAIVRALTEISAVATLVNSSASTLRA